MSRFLTVWYVSLKLLVVKSGKMVAPARMSDERLSLGMAQPHSPAVRLDGELTVPAVEVNFSPPPQHSGRWR
jgi:hypothetical protein